jgi:hypothetical protein
VSETKRKPGRPAKYPKGEKRPTLTFRVRGGLHEQLQAAAARSGLSLSEEIERRVALTFDDVDALARMVGGLVRAGQALTGRTWREDPDTVDVILGLIIRQFAALRCDPEGALLAQDAHEAYRHHLGTAWRNRDPESMKGKQQGK